MKKLCAPFVLAAFLLAGCLPQTDAGVTPQPTAVPLSTPTASAGEATVSPSVSKTTATLAATPSASVPAYWPSEIPASVPVFDYGKHVQTAVSAGEVTVVFSNVSKEDYAAYRDALKSAGFFLADESIEPVGVSAFSMNGPNCVISLRVTKDDYAELKYTPAG